MSRVRNLETPLRPHARERLPEVRLIGGARDGSRPAAEVGSRRTRLAGRQRVALADEGRRRRLFHAAQRGVCGARRGGAATAGSGGGGYDDNGDDDEDDHDHNHHHHH